MLKSFARKLLPRPLWTHAAYLYRSLQDAAGLLTGTGEELMPPKRKIFVGSGDFREIGAEFLQYFVSLGRLRPEDRVLDVGCGIGRMALPLTKYLSPAGHYEGFDIVPEGIRWCHDHISPRYPNFRFTLADVYNEAYHPEGTCAPADYRFPYEDGTFDFVFLTSVFTHMRPPDVTHYLSEISRVLKPGGRCLATFFLLNPESEALIAAGSCSLDFEYDLEHGRTTDPDVPEQAIAYDEAYVRGLFEAHGLLLAEPVQYGSWCGRTAFLSYQDLCIVEKQ